MLMKTAIYHEDPSPQDEPIRQVSGQYLSHNRLNARDRARLAADIIAGHVTIDPSTLTIGQTVKLCRANRITSPKSAFLTA